MKKLSILLVFPICIALAQTPLAQRVADTAAAYAQSLLGDPTQRPKALANMLLASCQYVQAKGTGTCPLRLLARQMAAPIVNAPYAIPSTTIPVGNNGSVGTFLVPVSDASVIMVQLDATDLGTKPDVLVSLGWDYSADGGNTWKDQGGVVVPGGIQPPGTIFGFETTGIQQSATGVVRLKFNVTGESFVTSGSILFCGGDDCPQFPTP